MKTEEQIIQEKATPIKRPFKSKIHDIMWDGSNPYPDTQHSYLISNQNLRRIRILCMLYAFIVVFCECYEEDNPIVNFKFLTFYGELTCLIYFSLVVFNKYWKLAHILFEIGFSVQITICLMYWIAVYPTQEHDGSRYFYMKTISAHGGMFCIIWLDNIFNEVRFYKRHTILLVLFVITYLSLNFTITMVDKPVYKPINWKTLDCYIYIVLAVLMGLFHFFFGIQFYDIIKKVKINKHQFKLLQASHPTTHLGQQLKTAHRYRRANI